MRKVTAYATPGPKEPFEKTTIERRDLGPKDVLIKIAFAGICHSDIHTAHDEWGEAIFPLVPGHEIAGTVEEVGARSPSYSVGDRVGVGCMVDSCRECENCQAGEEQYCLNGNVGTYNGDRQATADPTRRRLLARTSSSTRTSSSRIPEGIGLDVAAPLLCAGITLYSPLRHWNAGPGKKVAIVGIGGLGHMGVKIAARDGRRGHRPLADARQGGGRQAARRRPLLRDQRRRRRSRSSRGTFDLIVNTVSATLPIDSLPVAAAARRHDGQRRRAARAAARPGVLADRRTRRSFAGSAIGGIRETQEMLDFCAEHGIGAEIEVDQRRRDRRRLGARLNSDVRYRFVIDTADFDSISPTLPGRPC